MDAKTVPGQSGQPEKDLQQPGFDSMQLVATTSPTIDYYMRSKGVNPLQDTSPIQNEVPGSNDSKRPGMPRTANDINGGGKISVSGE